jgi:hypothetical protein
VTLKAADGTSRIVPLAELKLEVEAAGSQLPTPSAEPERTPPPAPPSAAPERHRGRRGGRRRRHPR